MSRQQDERTLPVAVYLCPVHFEHFYVPDDMRRSAGDRCPEDGCQEQMVRFTRVLGVRKAREPRRGELPDADTVI